MAASPELAQGVNFNSGTRPETGFPQNAQNGGLSPETSHANRSYMVLADAVTAVQRSIKLNKGMSAIEAVNRLFQKPENTVTSGLRANIGGRADIKLPPPTFTSPEGEAPGDFVDRMLNDVAREVQSNRRSKNADERLPRGMIRDMGKDTDAAARDVLGARGSNSLHDVKGIIASAAEALIAAEDKKSSITVEDALLASIQDIQERNSAVKKVNGLKGSSVPGIVWDQGFEMRIARADIEPTDFVNLVNAKRADVRSTRPVRPEAPMPADEASTKQADNSGIELIDLVPELTLKNAANKKREGIKPEDEDSITIARRGSRSFPDQLTARLNAKEITPGQDATAELVLVTASSDSKKAVSDIVEGMRAADQEQGVVFANVPDEIVTAGVFDALGMGRVHATEKLGDGRTAVLYVRGSEKAPQPAASEPAPSELPSQRPQQAPTYAA